MLSRDRDSIIKSGRLVMGYQFFRFDTQKFPPGNPGSATAEQDIELISRKWILLRCVLVT